VKDYAGLAGPAYLLLIAVELCVARRRGERLYRLDDAINDLSTGILMQLLVLGLGGLIVAGYVGVYQGLRLFEWSPERASTWIACFLAVDFAYYWFHRLSHEVNFLWAAHVVHHQSEDYNLAVALRQSALQPFFSAFFYLPLALLGFPPLVFFACSAANTIYQFWLHTQLIGRLGPLEAVLVTPSHHRVHHGRNPVYIDRNHGGTFILWDRLFGTFQREEQEVVYGITKPLASWNPLWANLHYWVELVRSARETRTVGDKLRMFLAEPGWFPEDLGGPKPPPPVDAAPVKFDRPYPRRVGEYAALQFAFLTLLAVGLISFGRSLEPAIVVTAALAVVWGLVNLGGLFESRPWAPGSEAARVGLLPLAALVLFSGGEAWLWAGVLALGTALYWLRLRRAPLRAGRP
jgi:sterol desaturase/sphingolipid hydroxylase (fatty acid hydroxylase superfamily)